MKASFLDLRKRSKQILEALLRHEEVVVTYRGKPTAVMRSITEETNESPSARQHEAFGLWADREEFEEVDQQVRRIRKGRYDAL